MTYTLPRWPLWRFAPERAPGAPEGTIVFQHACKMGKKELSLSDWDRVTDLGVLQIG